MPKEYTVVIEQGADGYLISEVVELPGCHTQAKTLDELLKRTKEAIELCLMERPASAAKQTFLGIQKLAV